MTTQPLAPSAQPEASAAAPWPQELAELDIGLLDPDPGNPRGNDPGGDLEGLAASIRGDGPLAPIRVRPGAVPGRFTITCGFRRFEAHKLAGRDRALCLIDRRPADPVRFLREAIGENLHRENIPAVPFARALSRLQQLGGHTLAELAAVIGKKDVSFVSRKLSLLKFSRGVQDAIDGAPSDESTFVEIAKVRNPEEREALAQRALREPMTREQAAQLAASRGRRRRASGAADRPLKRLLCPLPGGATVAVTCPDNVPELDTETALFALEFAVRELKKACRQGVPAPRLRSHFQQLRPKDPKTADANGRAAAPPAPVAQP